MPQQPNGVTTPTDFLGGADALARIGPALADNLALSVTRGRTVRRRRTFYDSRDDWYFRAGAALSVSLTARGTSQLLRLAAWNGTGSEIGRLTALEERVPTRSQVLRRTPPGAVREAVTAARGPLAIRPCFTVETATCTLTAGADDREVLKVRCVQVAMPGPTPDFCVVHLDFSDWSVPGAYKLATRLARDLDLQPQRRDLTAEIFARQGHTGVVTAPKAPRVQPGDSLVAAARRVFAGHLEIMAFNEPSVRLGVSADGVHNMRVAARRARCALGVFADAIPDSAGARLESDLRWLRDVLGEVRDLDVYLECLPDYATAVSADDARYLRAYASDLLARRQAARHQLTEALESPRYRAFMEAAAVLVDKLGTDTVGGPAAVPILKAAPQLIEARVRQVKRRGQKAFRRCTAGRLHRLRIACKKLRYTCEWLEELYGRPLKRFTKRVVGLQNLLGRHQDAVVAERQLRAAAAAVLARPNGDSHFALFVFGQLAARQQQMIQRCRLIFPDQWLRFKRKKRLARLRRHLAAGAR